MKKMIIYIDPSQSSPYAEKAVGAAIVSDPIVAESTLAKIATCIPKLRGGVECRFASGDVITYRWDLDMILYVINKSLYKDWFSSLGFDLSIREVRARRPRHCAPVPPAPRRTSAERWTWTQSTRYLDGYRIAYEAAQAGLRWYTVEEKEYRPNGSVWVWVNGEIRGDLDLHDHDLGLSVPYVDSDDTIVALPVSTGSHGYTALLYSSMTEWERELRRLKNLSRKRRHSFSVVSEPPRKER